MGHEDCILFFFGINFELVHLLNKFIVRPESVWILTINNLNDTMETNQISELVHFHCEPMKTDISFEVMFLNHSNIVFPDTSSTKQKLVLFRI